MIKHLNITQRFIFFYIVLSTFIFIIIGFFGFKIVKQAIISQSKANLEIVRLESTDHLINYLNNIKREINYISKTNYYNSLYDSIVMKDKTNTAPLWNAIFNMDNRFDRVDIYRNSKLGISAFPSSNKAEPIITTLTSARVISEENGFYENNGTKGTEYYYHAYSPQIGLHVNVKISLDLINDIIFKAHEKSNLTGEIYLISSYGEMLVSSRFENFQDSTLIIKSSTYKKAMQSMNGTEITNDYRKIKVLSSFDRLNIDNLSWVILSEIDLIEILKPIKSAKIFLFAMLLFLFGLSTIVVVVSTKNLRNSINVLKEGITSLGKKGEIGKIQGFGENEIQELIDSFNIMKERLKVKSLNIELERLQRLSSMLDGQQYERSRLSRDLHDGVGQSILTAKMQLERVSFVDSMKDKKIITDAKDILQDTANELRNIYEDLTPTGIKEYGLIASVKDFAQKITNRSEINIVANFTNEIIDVPLEHKLILYRIIQEAFNNIEKHSKAENAIIEYETKNDHHIFTINDDGIGFDLNKEKKKNNYGITNMSERIKVLKGELLIKSLPNIGTTIIIKTPANE